VQNGNTGPDWTGACVDFLLLNQSCLRNIAATEPKQALKMAVDRTNKPTFDPVVDSRSKNVHKAVIYIKLFFFDICLGMTPSTRSVQPPLHHSPSHAAALSGVCRMILHIPRTRSGRAHRRLDGGDSSLPLQR
jgi:hypothetical protein